VTVTGRDDASWTGNLEQRAFRALNAVVRPSIQRGFGSPCITPWGLVVLEHTGRRTGRQYQSPLLAMRMGRQVVVTTYRSERSNWIRNLQDQPRTHLWMNGERRPVRAHVVNSKGSDGRAGMADGVARTLRPAVRAMLAAGFAVSVLEPA
jgi:deazaflavin-dependent oxidoreductase (nitroreductase family)